MMHFFISLTVLYTVNTMTFDIPVYPGWHIHLYPLISSMQSPYSQGLLAQSSSLTSQFGPDDKNISCVSVE